MDGVQRAARHRRLCFITCVSTILLLLISQAFKHSWQEDRRRRDVLDATEISAEHIDPAAIDLTPLVNTLINSSQSGSRQLFSLLSVTSYSSLALHKLTLLVYNISSIKSVESNMFRRRFCYCVTNETNDLTDFTAILLDVMGNSTSYLHELFKSSSILSVSQRNNSDCIYICVMAGKMGREVSELWQVDSITPLFNQTIVEGPHRVGNISAFRLPAEWHQLPTNLSHISPSGISSVLTSRVHSTAHVSPTTVEEATAPTAAVTSVQTLTTPHTSTPRRVTAQRATTHPVTTTGRSPDAEKSTTFLQTVTTSSQPTSTLPLAAVLVTTAAVVTMVNAQSPATATHLSTVSPRPSTLSPFISLTYQSTVSPRPSTLSPVISLTHQPTVSPRPSTLSPVISLTHQPTVSPRPSTLSPGISLTHQSTVSPRPSTLSPGISLTHQSTVSPRPSTLSPGISLTHQSTVSPRPSTLSPGISLTHQSTVSPRPSTLSPGISLTRLTTDSHLPRTTHQHMTSAVPTTRLSPVRPVGSAVTRSTTGPQSRRTTPSTAAEVEKPGCPWRRPELTAHRVSGGTTTLSAHKLQPCVLELCKFFSQCLCSWSSHKARLKRYCDDSHLWYEKHTSEVCRRVRRISFSRNLKQRCLTKMCSKL